MVLRGIVGRGWEFGHTCKYPPLLQAARSRINKYSRLRTSRLLLRFHKDQRRPATSRKSGEVEVHLFSCVGAAAAVYIVQCRIHVCVACKVRYGIFQINEPWSDRWDYITCRLGPGCDNGRKEPASPSNCHTVRVRAISFVSGHPQRRRAALYPLLAANTPPISHSWTNAQQPGWPRRPGKLRAALGLDQCILIKRLKVVLCFLGCQSIQASVTH